MKEQLRGVAKAITKTEGEIDRVTAQISELVETIKAAKDKRDEETARRLETKEEQLRDKEKMLMEREQGGKQPGRQSPLEGQ